jgi:DHA2 family multidrug resistance protein-like MFS transporter
MPRDERLRPPSRESLAQGSLLGGAVLAVMLAVTQASTGTAAWLMLLAPAAALMLLWSRHSGSRAIVGVVSRSGIGSGLAALALVVTATAALWFLMPFYLERVLGQDPTTTGVVILASPAAIALSGFIAGVIADRLGPRRVAVGGAVVLGAGVALTVSLNPGWGPLDLAWRLAIVGIGMGAFNGPNQTAIIAAASAGDQATAGAASGLARSLGFACGPLLATTAWAVSGYEPSGMRVGIGVATALCVAVALVTISTPRGERSQPIALAATGAS